MSNLPVPSFWPQSINEARELQHSLSRQVQLIPLKKKVGTVAGIDAAFVDRETVAAITLFDYATLSLLDEAHCVTKTPLPYVPGYLSFREGPAILCALERLPVTPDIILLDGQGIAHPRRFGIASHIGLLTNIPSIGCAKSRLLGTYREPPHRKGSWSTLSDNRKETIGAVLRTRSGVRPLFVSPGHLITLLEAIEVVLHCTTRYRIPEPLRAADRLSKRLRKEILAV